jgi:hypothetical protein
LVERSLRAGVRRDRASRAYCAGGSTVGGLIGQEITKVGAMPRHQQGQMAVQLASLVLPFESLSDRGQPEKGLAQVAGAIRQRSGLVELDQARRTLYSMAKMDAEVAPEGATWFTFGASVAWIYAADAKTTAIGWPSSAFNRVLDLLEAADEDQGDTSLSNELVTAVGENPHPDAPALRALAVRVEQAFERLRSR